VTIYSDTEFAVRVLRDLGLAGAEETPSSADTEWARETAASEIAMLAAIGMPIWNGSDMAVPIEYLSTLSRRVGIAVEPSFGRTTLAQAQLAMREAERYLTVLASGHPGRPKTLVADDGLTRRGTFNFTSGV
jgi:hypothetical protein